MDPYLVLLSGTGFLVLLVAWLPMVLRELPLSLPIFCVLFGVALFSLHGGGAAIDPLAYPALTERITELIVLVALMGAGLKLDRRVGWRRWSLTWRLLGIGMPLSIALITGLGVWLLGLDLAPALLLGAALAPTDPVLASDVQVGPPKTGEEDEVRFALTSEAGLNDGLAAPFVMLALLLADGSGVLPSRLWHWLAVDVLWSLGAGVGIGWLVGWALGYAAFRLPNRAQLSRTGDGFVALGITLAVYGLTQLAHGYGFVAVFVTGLALRESERQHEYHERLHDFTEQTERLLMMMVLVLFGGALAHGLLRFLTWQAALTAVAIVLVARPLAGLVALHREKAPFIERAAIAFFGIRGVGSFYYLAFAFGHARFAEAELIWAVVGLVVLISILLHGVTVTPVMDRLDHARTALREAQPAVPSPVLPSRIDR